MDQNGYLLKSEYSKYPPLVQGAISIIESNYTYLYGVDDLADRLEVTKHHLIRVFTANTGISPGKYLTNIRIIHARSMLQSCEDTPMEIIAGACGYSCAHYFSKVFKKQTGMTPSEFANAFRQDSDGVEAGLLLQKLYL